MKACITVAKQPTVLTHKGASLVSHAIVYVIKIMAARVQEHLTASVRGVRPDIYCLERNVQMLTSAQIKIAVKLENFVPTYQDRILAMHAISHVAPPMAAQEHLNSIAWVVSQVGLFQKED